MTQKILAEFRDWFCGGYCQFYGNEDYCKGCPIKDEKNWFESDENNLQAEFEPLTEAAFYYASKRFPNAKNKDCGIVAQEQYACRAGFMAGVEWQKEQSHHRPSATELLINMLSTTVARTKGISLSKQDCKEWVKELKKK